MYRNLYNYTLESDAMPQTPRQAKCIRIFFKKQVITLLIGCQLSAALNLSAVKWLNLRFML